MELYANKVQVGKDHILTDKTCDKSVKIFIDGVESNNKPTVFFFDGFCYRH